MDAPRSTLFIQSLDKAMRVLEAFSRGEQFLGLSEIAALSGLDKASAQRCVHTLCQIGYLEKNAKTSRFSLGKKCLDLSFHFLRTHPLVVAATPSLLQLRKDSGERTNLSLYDKTTLIYAIRLHGKRESLYFQTLIGRRMPTFCSSGGRIMLAQLPRDEMKAVIAQSDLSPMTKDTITDPKKIYAKVDEARERGYAMVVGENTVGEITIAGAVVDSDGRPIAAVHIAGSSSKWDPGEYEQKFGPLVVEVSRALSHSGSGAVSLAV
jgi:IclR family pca regulon transcriptional regulator